MADMFSQLMAASRRRAEAADAPAAVAPARATFTERAPGHVVMTHPAQASAQPGGKGVSAPPPSAFSDRPGARFIEESPGHVVMVHPAQAGGMQASGKGAAARAPRPVEDETPRWSGHVR